MSKNHGVVSLTWEFVNHLDTGLRRYDAVFSNGQSGLKAVGMKLSVEPEHHAAA